MKTKPIAVMLVLITTVLTSFGQYFYKLGTNALPTDPVLIDYLLNKFIIIGLGVYFIGAILLITALKYGELSVLYPIIATSYIWVSLISVYFFNEQMNLLKWGGICAVIVGVSLIGLGASRQESQSQNDSGKVPGTVL